MAKRKQTIFVVGHRNPDTDSICSAICYANLKNMLQDGKEYIAMRAGVINEETEYVLKRFGVPEPFYLKDVRTQVRDIEIRDTQGVSQEVSLKKAWQLMKESNNVVTLPITEDDKLIGILSVRDIATSYMDVYDNKILGTARTKYKNILETLDASLVVGNGEGIFQKGKVLVAAADSELAGNYMEPQDLVILGNREDIQRYAIEKGVACIVVCLGATVSEEIKALAQEKGCTVISTMHDTYTVARLINQSMPISYFMCRDNLITFRLNDYTDDIKVTMAKRRHRDFPVLDKSGNYVGMISRRNLLNMSPKKIILVDHNEKSQAVEGVENAEILEIIDHHRLGSLETITPVFFRNQPLGCTATIVYQMYRENHVEISKTIASLLCAAILSDTLIYRSPTCTPYDRQAAEELAVLAGIDVEEFASEMLKAGTNLKDKSAEEIFYRDFKTFSMNDVSFGVGQVNAMTREELTEIKEKIRPYMEGAIGKMHVNMVFFMLTDILGESTELLFAGKNAEGLVEDAFNVSKDEDSFRLDGVVSRKKQLLPALMAAVQQ